MNLESLYKLYLKHPVVNTDSRKITPGSLFFALKGPNFNGNAYATAALEQGAAYAIIDESAYQRDKRCILVKDVLTTLQALARYHREELKIPVIAIVGSNGKTTTKELMYAVLSKKFNVRATPGNFNNHIGVPLTLLQLQQEHEYAIIEMGANHIGENALLCEIAKPNYGVVTNIGKDHLEGFGSIEGVAQANSELYYYLLKNGGIALVNARDEWLMRMSSRLKEVVTYGGWPQAEVPNKPEANSVGVLEASNPFIQFRITESAGREIPQDQTMTSHLIGQYNFDNIMVAVCLGQLLGVSTVDIAEAIGSYEPKNNRSQWVKKEKNNILLDAYNANPSSMEAALKAFAALPGQPKVAILGDMFELGRRSKSEHQNIVKMAKELAIDQFLLVGPYFSSLIDQVNGSAFETVDQLKLWLQEHSLEGCQVFIKGSRGMKLEAALDAIH